MVHHSEWQYQLSQLQLYAPLREQVRFLSTSQPCAGAWLNAVPKWGHFRVRTTNHRLLVQRRCGLPLRSVAQAEGDLRSSRYNKVFDLLGDVAQNLGEAGHQTRHRVFAQTLRKVCRRAFGSALKYEPSGYKEKSDHRPDLSLLDNKGELRYFDVKVFDPLGSDPGKVGLRGGCVGFGNTHPRAYEKVHGLHQRGEPRDGNFRPKTGEGYVATVEGDYDRAKHNGCKVTLLLVETFGGFHQDLLDFLYEAKEALDDKLSKEDYDNNTWATTKWFSFAVQQVAVAFHNAVAQESLDAVCSAAAKAVPVSPAW